MWAHFNKYVEQFKIYGIPMALNGYTYSFVIIKNPKHDPNEPYIYFISDLKDAKAIANHYLKRWKIECAFKHLKTNGFNIENANLKDDLKIDGYSHANCTTHSHAKCTTHSHAKCTTHSHAKCTTFSDKIV